jgi:DNA-binding IclR family transcriptional regulator
MPKPRNVLKSVDTVFEMVEHLKAEGGKTVTELSEELDMPKSTVQVYLNSLYRHNFVVKNDGRYEVGLRFLEFGIYALRNVVIYPEVRSKVEELAGSTGELASCFVEEEGEAVYIYGVEGERSVRTDLSVGDRTDLHCTASGKAIMAHLPDRRVRQIVDEHGLERKTEQTITDLDELREELSRIRDRGYSYSMEESVEGMRAVAAPILLDGRVVGSISLAGPANRFVGDRFETELPDLLRGAANELELKLTYSQSGI